MNKRIKIWITKGTLSLGAVLMIYSLFIEDLNLLLKVLGLGLIAFGLISLTRMRKKLERVELISLDKTSHRIFLLMGIGFIAGGVYTNLLFYPIIGMLLIVLSALDLISTRESEAKEKNKS